MSKLNIPSFIDNSVRIDFKTVTGKVISVDKIIATKVSGSGGGGHIGSYGGTVHSVSINSQNIVHQDIWLQHDSGLETHFRLINKDVPIKEGQLITVVIATNVNNQKSCEYVLVNHNSNMKYCLENASSLIYTLGIRNYTNDSTGCAIIIIYLILWFCIKNWSELIANIIGWVICFCLIYGKISTQILKSKLKRHLKSIQAKIEQYNAGE